MGWLLWGVLLGWASCAIYAHTQRGEDPETTANGAMVVICILFICAIAVSIGFGVATGAIPTPTPTPILGR